MNGLTHEKILREEEATKEKFRKSGLLKRLLGWVAKGVDKSHMGKRSCLT